MHRCHNESAGLPQAAGLADQARRHHLREGGAALDEARELGRGKAQVAPVRVLPWRDQPRPENIINRNFQAAAPNEKWLTEITEFQIPADNV